MSQWFSITIGVCAERSEFSLAISRLQKSMKVVGQALAALFGLKDARMAMAKIITPHRASADERLRSVRQTAAVIYGVGGRHSWPPYKAFRLSGTGFRYGGTARQMVLGFVNHLSIWRPTGGG